MAESSMTMVFTLLSLCCLLCLITCGHGLRVIDLTYDLDDKFVTWPGNPIFNFTVLNRGAAGALPWFEINAISTPEHHGTHVDAPAHFHEKGWRSHQIPASRLVAPAVVVDVSAKADRDPDYLMTTKDLQVRELITKATDLQDWEGEHGQIPVGAAVLMNSGWGARYPDPRRVLNPAAGDDPSDPASTLHFPGLHPDAAAWLVAQRDVVAVGVDTPSTDGGTSTTFMAHRALARAAVLGVENVRNVPLLPPVGATVVLGLVKVKDGSGGPARVLALIGDLEGSGMAALPCGCWWGAGGVLIVVSLAVVVTVLVMMVLLRKPESKLKV